MKKVFYYLLIPFVALFAAPLQAQNDGPCPTYQVSSATAAPGETVCLDIRVRDFTEIISIQFSMNWDPDYFSFESVGNFNLPGLAQTNFGFTDELAGQGFLTVAWIDNLLQGVTVADSTVIFSLCLNAIGNSGNSSPVEFSAHPTVTEFISLDLLPVFPAFLNGAIHIDQNGPLDLPEIAAGCAWTLPCELGLNLGVIDITMADTSGSYNYNWYELSGTDAILVSNEEDLNGVEPGDYEVVVTDGNGHSVSGEFHLAEGVGFDLFEAEITDASCENGNDGSIDLTMEGDPAMFTFLWSTGDTTEDITDLSPGTYEVTITIDNDCSISRSYTVELSSTINIPTIITQPTCLGDDGAIDLDPSATGIDYDFLWSTGDTTEDITGLSEGIYTVTITDPNSGCSDEEFFVLPEFNFLVANSYLCQVIDNDSIISEITAFVGEGSTSPYEFAWSTGEVTQADQFSSITVPHDGSYSVTVTDQNGCTAISGPIEPDCSNFDPDGQVQIAVTSTQVDPGDSFCVDVQVGNFNEIIGMQFSMAWDSDLIEFDSFDNFNLPDLDVTDLGNPANYGGNQMAMSWIDNSIQGVTLPDNSTIFSLCFTAIAPGQTNIIFQETPTPFEVVNLAEEVLDLNHQSGTVTVGDFNSQSFVLNASEENADLGGSACVAVTAEGFDSIASLQFSMGWDASKLQFDSLHNYNPLLESLFFDGTSGQEELDQGIFRFAWLDDNIFGISIPDHETLFELCFTALEGPGTYEVFFSDTPLEVEAVNGNLVELVEFTNDGAVVVGNPNPDPDALIVEADQVFTAPGLNTCVDISARNFVNIASIQFTTSWDPSLVEFTQVIPGNVPGLTSGNFGLTQADDGDVLFSWLDPNATGLDLPDNTVLFTLCFEVGSTVGVSPVSFGDNPLPIEVVLGTTEIISMDGQDGSVTISTQLVWPGDTDRNDEVNHVDLLNIGLAYNSTGAPREDPTIDWIPQNAENWAGQTPASGINFKYIDADGNGTVDATDTLAIVSNWGETTSNFQESPDSFNQDPESLNPDGIPLYVLPDTLNPGEQASFAIILGSEDDPATEVYGIAFTVVYDPGAIVEESIYTSLLNSWMGDPGTDLISIHRDDYQNNKLDIAITRIDGVNQSGTGQIASIHMTIEDVIFRSDEYELLFDIRDVRLINALEEEIPVEDQPTMSLIIDESTDAGSEFVYREVKISPVPAREWLNIEAGSLEVQVVELYSVAGVKLREFQEQTRQIQLQGLPNGSYWLRIHTDKGLTIKRFQKI